MANDSIDDLLSDWGDEVEEPIVSNRPKPPSSRSSNSIFDDDDDEDVDDSDDVDLTSMANEIDDDEDEDELITRQPDYDQVEESNIDFDDSLPVPNIDELPLPDLDSIYDDMDANEEPPRHRRSSNPVDEFVNDDEEDEDNEEDDDYSIPTDMTPSDKEDDEFPSLDFPEQDQSIDEVDLSGINDDLEDLDGSSMMERRPNRNRRRANHHDEDDSSSRPNDDIEAEDLTDDHDETNPFKSINDNLPPVIQDEDKKDEDDEKPGRKFGFKFPKITASRLINAPIRLLMKIRKARRMYWIASSLAGLFIVLWSFLNIGAANSKGGAVDTAVNEGSVEVASTAWNDGHVEAVLKNKSDMIAHVAGEANVKTWSPDYRPASWVSPRVVMSCKIPQEDIDPGKSVTIKPTDCKGKVHGVWPRVQVKLDYQ